MEQTTFVSPSIETTNQEIEAQSYFKQIKTFRTVGTQTEDLQEQGFATTHPDDINELLHLETTVTPWDQIRIL